MIAVFMCRFDVTLHLLDTLLANDYFLLLLFLILLSIMFIYNKDSIIQGGF